MPASAILVILLVAASGPVLLLWGRWARQGPPRSVVVTMLRYQGAAVPFAIAVWLCVRLLVPEHGSVEIAGNLDAPVAGLGWMGVSEGEVWGTLLLTTGSIIVVVTGVVLWLQTGRGSGVTVGLLVRALPWAVGLAVLNATSEELIFRVALIEGLQPSISASVVTASVVAVLSGILFGLPHWAGHPGGPVGAVLAGFLGWLAATATLQTSGIAWAWLLHVVLDVVILSIVVAVGRVPGTVDSEMSTVLS